MPFPSPQVRQCPQCYPDIPGGIFGKKKARIYNVVGLLFTVLLHNENKSVASTRLVNRVNSSLCLLQQDAVGNRVL